MTLVVELTCGWFCSHSDGESAIYMRGYGFCAHFEG
jgi:hypothetical protein